MAAAPPSQPTRKSTKQKPTSPHARILLSLKDLPETVQAVVPAKWEKIGDIVILKGYQRDLCKQYTKEIVQAVLQVDSTTKWP